MSYLVYHIRVELARTVGTIAVTCFDWRVPSWSALSSCSNSRSHCLPLKRVTPPRTSAGPSPHRTEDTLWISQKPSVAFCRLAFVYACSWPDFSWVTCASGRSAMRPLKDQYGTYENSGSGFCVYHILSRLLTLLCARGSISIYLKDF